MVATIEESIKTVAEGTAQILNTPMEIGSDAYLDKVLHFKERFEEMMPLFSKLNNDLIEVCNQDRERLERLLAKLKELHISCLNLVNLFRNSAFGTALKTTISNYRDEVDQLREILDDYNTTDKLKDNAELQNLFSLL